MGRVLATAMAVVAPQLAHQVAHAQAVSASASIAQTGAPATPAAAADQAALRAQYDALFQRILTNPADIDATLRFAEVATRLERYEAAIGALERILFYNVQLPRVHLELGILYFRLGSYEIARQHLQTAISAPDVPDDVRRRVNEFLAEAQKRLSRNQLTADLRLGLRYQTNANIAPLGNTYRVFGTDLDLPSGAKRRPDWNVFSQLAVHHIYDLRTQDSDRIETNLQAYQALQFKETRFDLGLVEIDSGPRLALTTEGVRSTFRPYVLANYVELAHRRYLTTFGGGLSMAMYFSDALSAEARLEYRKRDFNNSKRNPDVSIQSGDLAEPSWTMQYKFSDDFVLLGRLAFGSNAADQRFYSYWLYQGDVSATWNFAMPGINAAGKSTLTPFLSYVITDYRAANPTFDPDTVRHDREWRLGASLDVPVMEHVGTFALVQYSAVNSSLPNFKSRNLAISFGISLRY
jgi:tetratricopeptide (TPR) repeat protein